MNPWKILGVNRSMTLEEIHDVYLKLARKYHPDVGDDHKQQFSIITGAYSLLKNKEELTRFIANLKAVGKDCDTCRGQGATFKQRGMTSRVATTCNDCEGSGIIINKGRNK